MSYQDQSLKCADCGQTFVFTAGEQEFYSTKGFSNIPKRCQDCRSKRKAQSSRGGRSDRGGERGGRGGGFKKDRPKFAATCSRCGAAFDAPFQPKDGLPIFCRPCFEASKK